MLPGSKLGPIALALCALGALAQPEKRAVILPQTEARTLIGKTIEPKLATTGTWEPTQAAIDVLEKDLDQIADLSQSNSSDRKIKYPREYFRQYLGLLAGSRRLIYTNAFCGDHNDKPPAEWRSKLVVIKDGGSCVWQAIYDVSTKRFMSLSVNEAA